MTSKLVVNTIEADTGISSVSFASSISMDSTSKFHFSAAGVDIGADTNINRPAAGVLSFNISGAEKLRIDTNGHLNTSGIATASNFKTGSSNLHSTGLTVGNNFLHSTGINVGTGATIHVPATNTLTFGTNSNERLRINSTGNMGLGVSDPNVLNEAAKFQELTIGGKTEGAAITLKDDNGNVQGGLFTSDNTGAMIIRTITNHPLMFRTNNTERLRITSGGNVNIGGEYTQTTYPFQLTGSGGGDAAAMAIKNLGTHPAKLHLMSGHGNWSVSNSTTVGDAFEVRDEGANSTRMIITSDGNVRANVGSFDSLIGYTVDVSIDTSSWTSNTFYRVVNDNVFDNGSDTYLVYFNWTHGGSGSPWIVRGNFLYTSTGANVTGAVSDTFTPVQTSHTGGGTISWRGQASGNVRPGLSAKTSWDPSGGTLYIKASKIGHPS